jgi:uncharacterized protein (DUF302 family)
MRARALAFLLIVSPAVAQAADAIVYPFDGSFEDATFAVENALIGRGLVVDHVSHVGEMLDRTAADVGSATKIFDAADVFQFCTAVLSRKVMEADPLNIAHCPYGIFVFDRGGSVSIGYRNLPDGAMQEVEDLLEAIVKEATGG